MERGATVGDAQIGTEAQFAHAEFLVAEGTMARVRS